MDDWTLQLEEGGQIGVIYTDFEKSSDKVPHKRVISKLYSYGINQEVIKWIEAFLTNICRIQQVQVNDHFSGWSDVLGGIPQGSILCPLLFIIYINDLIDTCHNSTLFLYADDCKLYMYVNEHIHCLALQEDKDNLSQQADEWKLKLKVSNCSLVSYGRTVSYNFGYRLSGTSLHRADSIKDLGVIFDSKLKFNKHVDTKVNIAYQNSGIIKRNFTHIIPDCFVLLYKSLVRSH